jgi:hypothetical protein
MASCLPVLVCCYCAQFDGRLARSANVALCYSGPATGWSWIELVWPLAVRCTPVGAEGSNSTTLLQCEEKRRVKPNFDYPFDGLKELKVRKSERTISPVGNTEVKQNCSRSAVGWVTIVPTNRKQHPSPCLSPAWISGGILLFELYRPSEEMSWSPWCSTTGEGYVPAQGFPLIHIG